MAETTDERWRSCQDLGSLGPVLARNIGEVDKVVDLLKDCAKHDESGIVRYHGVLSLGKIAPYILTKRPDIIFDVANLCVGDGAKEIGSGCGIKDSYDRVRRGSMATLRMLTELPTKRTELKSKFREAVSRHLVQETYDVIRMDCCTLLGKLGPPVDRIGERWMKPLDDAAARNVDKAGVTPTDKLALFIAKLACYKLDRLPEWKIQLPKDINLFKERMWIQFEHWSYWPQRECLARALGEIGPLLTYFPKPVEQVLDMLELMANDGIFDVRAAAMKALGDFMPADAKMNPVVWQRIGPDVWQRATPILKRGLKDASTEVQEAARKALLHQPSALQMDQPSA